MFRRPAALAVAVIAAAGLLTPAAAHAAGPAPCPKNNVCVYGGENGELLGARTLAGWSGKSVNLYTTKIVNTTSRPISVTLSWFGDDFSNFDQGRAVSTTIRIAAHSQTAVASLDAKNIRAAR